MITYAESVDMLYIAFLCQGTGSGNIEKWIVKRRDNTLTSS